LQEYTRKKKSKWARRSLARELKEKTKKKTTKKGGFWEKERKRKSDEGNTSFLAIFLSKIHV
jgi:hypothetical protein